MYVSPLTFPVSDLEVGALRVSHFVSVYVKEGSGVLKSSLGRNVT